jgi:putative cell wall-binding protein
VASLLAALSLTQVGASAASTDPSQWPVGPGPDPELTTSANTIRFAGADRYATNLALGLALRGSGGFPFDTSDRTSGNAPGLASADGWWGAATCPRSIIVVAGDTFADALAAASLSDPLDRSQQPRLQRVAAADPLFDPVGGFDRPDTAYAPVVVTTSARSGATSLVSTARVTASDLAKGGCTTAREAIIVGGERAVPRGVESELISLGYDEVFRVAGSDRYDTAARVTVALGTQAPSTGDTCLDADSTDGSTRLGFYGNGVAEYRFDATSCRLLPRSVVLADGGTGADALAAGWWTSRWQVPLLLTAPDGSLPQATRTALQTIDIDTVIVLGGIGRIPEATVAEAQRLATATVGRIAGADRTQTSIEMAKAFGGWRPTGDGADFAGDVACIASSAGSGSNATGWPDALAAGPLCARLGARAMGGPRRALGPIAGVSADFPVAGGRAPAHDAIPIILLPAGADALSPAGRAFFDSTYTAASTWCSGGKATSCVEPGFAVLMGGEASISTASRDEIDTYVSGRTGPSAAGLPVVRSPFVTELTLSGYVRPTGTGPTVCAEPDALRDARWLSVTDDIERRRFRDEFDLLALGVYAGGVSAPVCAPLGSGGAASVTPVSIAGQPGVSQFWPGAADAVRLSGDIAQAASSRSDTTTWHVEGAPQTPVDVRRDGSSDRIVDATLDVTLTISGDGANAAVTGSFSVTTLSEAITGSISGVARRTSKEWVISGVIGIPAATLSGGLVATVPLNDGDLVWRFDAFRSLTPVSVSARLG